MGSAMIASTVYSLMAKASQGETLPNIIIINADDMGYGDLSCYGSQSIKTPNIDRLAENGVRFTDFYACASVCTPSRFGLLTGRYPRRVGINYLFFPKKWAQRAVRLASVGGMADGDDISNEVEGIPQDEITIAEALKNVGYHTALIGKWHLGNYLEESAHHPLEHGFDYFFGVPYSNSNKLFPLHRGREQIEENIQGEAQGKLTGLYTKEAIRYIESSKDKPFFCYFAHTFPHRPHFASSAFKNRSEGGRYGDTVEEVDWSVGEILKCLEKNNLDKNTLVFFTSDNGPWYNGSPGILRGRKGQSYDGGMRVPMIASWPGHIKTGTICRQPAMNIDLLPTCLSVAKASLPTDRIIDGQDISNLLVNPSGESPDRTFYFYHHENLEGIRHGKWKFYPDISTYVYPVPLKKIYDWSGGGPWLYNLELDPGESYNLRDKYPEKIAELTQIMDNWNRQIETNPKGQR